MKAFELDPPPESRIEFDGWDVRIRAPDVCGCYVIAAFDGEILYIGQSKKLCGRMPAHLRDAEKNRRTADGVARWFYYRTCGGESELSALERGWTIQFQARERQLPPFNKIMPPV